jgi:hypothetical protein
MWYAEQYHDNKDLGSKYARVSSRSAAIKSILAILDIKVLWVVMSKHVFSKLEHV